jgi:hypothetical protein
MCKKLVRSGKGQAPSCFAVLIERAVHDVHATTMARNTLTRDGGDEVRCSLPPALAC